MNRILLVDDHELIFSGLNQKISHIDLDFAPSLDDARMMIREQTYYAVILDITIGNSRGFDLIQYIPKHWYVFILSMHKSPVYIKQARSMGARGYFLKDESPQLLLEALKTPLARQFWMSETAWKELNRKIVVQYSSYEKLTLREQQIFSLLAQGNSYVDIGRYLNISKKTVNNHRDHIFKKLGISSQTELVHEAIKLGVVVLE